MATHAKNKGPPSRASSGGQRVVYNSLLRDDADDEDVGVELREFGGAGANGVAWKEPANGLSDASSSPNQAEDMDILGRSSWWSMYINLTSTILGAGMLGLPYAYANMGWFLGTIMIAICGTGSTAALFFLARCAKKTTAPSSFYKVAMQATPKYAFWIDAIIAVKCFGVATSYLVVVGDLVPMAMLHMFPDSSGLHSRTLWVLVGFCVGAPLSCLRSLHALRWTSGLSGVFLAFLLSLVIGYALPGLTGLDPCTASLQSADAAASSVELLESSLSDCHGSRAYLLVSAAALHVMPIFVFGFACQQNSFAIVNELSDPTIARIDSVFIASIGTAVIVYICMASAGYLAFGDTVKSNILVSYPNNNITSTARIFVSFVVAFHYPLQSHPARRSVLSLMEHLSRERANSPIQSGSSNPPPPFTSVSGGAGVGLQLGLAGAADRRTQHRRYVYSTAVFLALSLLVALSVSDLGLMLSLVGATGSTAISYILPGIFYFKMHPEPPVDAPEIAGAERELGAGVAVAFFGENPKWMRTWSWYQFVIGLFLVPFCLIAIFLVHSSSDA